MKNKLKAFLSFFLSLIIVFTVTPATVFASEYEFNTAHVIFSYGTLDSPTSFKEYDKSLPNSFTEGIISQIGFVQISTDTSIRCSSGDVINVTVGQSYSRYGYSFNCVRGTIRGIDSSGNTIYLADGTGIYDAEEHAFKYVDVSVPRDCTIEFISFGFEPQKVRYDGWTTSQACALRLTDFSVTVESEQSGFFNKVADFFKQLFEKLSSGLENIGSWFSDLGDKIGNFFSNLISNIQEQFTKMINNLKDFFSDVGQWFKDIGDRIGEFFSNLWDNISGKFEEFGNKISSWWQSVVNFFHSLFVPEPGYFDTYKANWETFIQNHFGMLYQSIEIVENVFNYLSTLGANDYSFTVPEIRLPFFNNPVIVPKTRFNFNSIISQHSQIKFVYNTFQTMVTFICFIGLAIFAKKTFEDIIGER